MRILYVAKHGSGGNDDEGAIAWALRQLRHEVVCIQEKDGRQVLNLEGDLLLFHKWHDVEALRAVAHRMKRAFWYFDLVETDDPTLQHRCRNRRQWMGDIIPCVTVGFCTDGDWVEKYAGREFGGTKEGHQDRLVWLMQGCDGRVAGFPFSPVQNQPPILFTGNLKGGLLRQSFVREMNARYGRSFNHIPAGVYGLNLGQTVASSELVVAPDYPVSDRYWSNRVYLTLGFGGFLLHPYSAGVAAHYRPDHEIKFYHDRDHLHELVSVYLGDEKRRHRQAQGVAARERTLKEHTYLARCHQLISEVGRRVLM